MDLERRLVAEPAQRRGPVGDEVVVGLAVLALAEALLVPDREPPRRAVRDVLLPEARGARAVREPLQVERPVREVREHRRGDAGEVADEVALGLRRLVDPVARREQDLVEVGQLELLARDGPGSLGLHRRQRAELRVRDEPGGIDRRRACLGHRPRASRHWHRRRDGRGRGKRVSRLAIGRRGIDRALPDDLARVAAPLQALERGLADVPVARPAADLRADHELGPDPAHARRGRRPSARGSRATAADRTAGRRSRARRAAPGAPSAPCASNPEPTLPEKRRRSPS